MGELDPTFIQEPEHRPKPVVIEAHGIPQIDLSPYINSSSPNAIHDLVDEIRDACKDWGFFQVINHGVPIEIREKLQSVAKRFFDQSLEEKKKVKRDEANPLGYSDTEHTKNVRDWKEVFGFMVDDQVVMPTSYDDDDDDGAVKYTNKWPHHPSELSLWRPIVAYGQCCHGRRLSSPPHHLSALYRPKVSIVSAPSQTLHRLRHRTRVRSQSSSSSTIAVVVRSSEPLSVFPLPDLFCGSDREDHDESSGVLEVRCGRRCGEAGAVVRFSAADGTQSLVSLTSK